MEDIMKKERIINHSLIGMTAILALILMGVLLKLDIVPLKYLLPGYLVLLVPLVFLSYQSLKTRKKAYKIALIVLSILLILPLSYILKLDGTMRKITNHNTEKHTINVLVLKESDYDTIEDVKDLPFGANTSIDPVAIEMAQSLIQEKENFKVHIQRYDDYKSLYDNFMDQQPEVIVLNDAHMSLMEEIDGDFLDKVRILASYDYEVALDDSSKTNTSTETFSIYISGLDFAGDIEETQRSDANIILTVNPLKKQILMTSIPRDTFVVRHTNGQKDKLSLVGRSGMMETMKTIEDFLEMDIDYSLKVNWTSVVEVVDALDGIEIHSPHAFKSGAYYFNQGAHVLDGPKALAFVTHRKTLPQDEDSRAQNQQIVLTAILKKVMSPSIITNYHKFLDAVSDSIILSMPEKQLNNLIRDQLDTMGSWDIFTTQITGEIFDTWDAYSVKGIYQVAKEPSVELLQQAQELIKMMEDNQTITQDMLEP